jgi:hypothetical protein
MKKLLLALIFTSGLYAQTTPSDLVICDYNNDGFAAFDLTFTAADILNNLPPNEYSLTYHETPDDAEEGQNAIANPENYININADAQTMYARVTEIANVDNHYTASFNLIINATPNAYPVNMTVIDDTDGNPNDDIVTVYYETLEYPILEMNSESGFEIDFFTNETLTVPIVFPYTVTTSATVYYRVQNAISGCMNSKPIFISIYIPTAGINDNALTTFKCYPNPASNILNIENATDIDSVSLVNALGQTVLSKTINGNIAQIDISSLSKGIYFVTVTSGNASKIIKVIKE